MYSSLFPQISLANLTTMESQISQIPEHKEVQVYRNDFLSGILLLAKKLFML